MATFISKRDVCDNDQIVFSAWWEKDKVVSQVLSLLGSPFFAVAKDKYTK